MAFQAQGTQTSLITIISCEHGRMRRAQRDISMRDLQKAVKYGTRRSGWGKRWMVEHDGVTFITDHRMRKEITSYPSPLAKAPLYLSQLDRHAKSKEVLKCKPDLSSSHTVLVVDNSGSMTSKDIDLYRCRQTAAYTMTALEFIAEQIFNETANNRDLFSLVEFNMTASVVFAREPLSWVVYNKILDLRDDRSYEEREVARGNDDRICDSNYMPALIEAEKLLATDNHATCALNLYFLSDGAPTDAGSEGVDPLAMRRKLQNQMEAISKRFGKQLNIRLVGFGSQYSDFSTLRAMAEAVNRAPGGAKAEFVFCDKMAQNLRTAASSLIASSTQTRTSLMEDVAAAAAARSGGSRIRTVRNVISEKESRVQTWQYFRISSHYIFVPNRGFVMYPGLPFGALRTSNVHEEMERRMTPPPYLAINTAHCGLGAERVAFRCHLVDERDSTNFVLGAMVAKETKLVEQVDDNIVFHKAFCETQGLAQHLADIFNKRIRALPDYNRFTTPLISFQKCSVFVLEDPLWKNGYRGVLVEKMLDTTKFQWRKWNDNAGGVNGSVAPIDVDMEIAKINQGLARLPLGAIDEGDSDEENGFGNHCGSWSPRVPIRHENSNSKRTPQQEVSEYLQAFTHFTFTYTNKKLLVCDLQGIYNTDMMPPTFELSDPAIHYSSNKGREMVFGRSDKGNEGIKLFFNTHKCSSVCKYLQLSKKNKSWRKHWHHDKCERCSKYKYRRHPY